MRGSDDHIKSQRNYQEKKRGLGKKGLMRAFNNKSTFGGNWDEDLDNCIKIINTPAMCKVSDEEKMKSIPVMLKNDTLNYCENNIKGCSNFEETLRLLRNLYNNDDKRSRILAKWQTMKFSDELLEEPK